ncbi:[FeFe] hydrogenase H-cluster radical SAM maturase HydE [Clostridium aminobutyricum]|uniref:[FeFe] hydrogenase H-cluster radical SAM maturase HydE n=1 Tax=Clostridium aminobutyricum TaxID=33953 RepID=A0A939D9Q3_CLOAM|nr:[FeFe] hydrogenase H-cluster radical SAM maturase HydE [Clostridium aminobutyricum]MBN7773792.1 [FeFe] hydrogenase H-cluster radical SAM maturase HydE [Clostridium aminobutyricum]
MKELIDQLEQTQLLTKKEFEYLLQDHTEESREYLFERARAVRHKHYGSTVFTRGLIEFTNYCKNDCYYCGIRRSNTEASRYRLTKEEIVACCENGHALGFRTFVLQGGEDNAFTDEVLVDIIKEIKENYPDCAITLSIGEKRYESYKAYFEAGADRYLLRHETANDEHYSKIHPNELTLENRKKCLWDLKEIGFQVGCGLMIGSPYQTVGCLADDLLFMHEFQPDMVGVGPFIAHHQTPFAQESNGTLEQTLVMVGIVRLMLPKVLLPATTALGTIAPNGRELGILAGANVVMPNLSPINVRRKYMLYDNKICTGDEAAECRVCMDNRMKSIGYELVVDRGDRVK